MDLLIVLGLIVFALWKVASVLSQAVAERPAPPVAPGPAPKPALPPPPQPTLTQTAAEAKKRYETVLRVIRDANMNETERRSAEDKAKQQYLKEFGAVLK